jgi:ribonuclease VapC
MLIESRAGIPAADDTLLILAQLEVEPLTFDAAHMHEAHEAWRRFGKGRHPASLNLGDCCAYSASKTEQAVAFQGQRF